MSDKAKKPLKIPQVGGVWDSIAPWVLLLGALLTTVGFILSFTVAHLVPGAAVNGVELIGEEMISNKLLLSQKIFYFHMPMAIASMVSLFFTAYYGVRFLMTKEKRFDTAGRVATEIALVFIVCTMISGEIWQIYEWQVWWTWDARLTTYLILMLLVIGYFILRNAIDDPERRASYASVFGIIAFIDVPICFMVTRLIPSSVHPVVFRTDSGMSTDMLIPLMLCMFGMFMIVYGLYRFRFRQAVLAERVEVIKEKLEDRG
ncbi:MAG: cytochrome c biogenesis protein CcsA [Raoultibacter sp.]|jgi:heme exporter protein C